MLSFTVTLVYQMSELLSPNTHCFSILHVLVLLLKITSLSLPWVQMIADDVYDRRLAKYVILMLWGHLLVAKVVLFWSIFSMHTFLFQCMKWIFCCDCDCCLCYISNQAIKIYVLRDLSLVDYKQVILRHTLTFIYH